MDKETPKIERSLLWFCSRSGSRDKGLGRTSCSGSLAMRCQQADQGALVAHEAALFARAPVAQLKDLDGPSDDRPPVFLRDTMRSDKCAQSASPSSSSCGHSCVDGMTSVKTLSTVSPSSSSVSVAAEVGSAWDLGGAQRGVACGGVEGGSLRMFGALHLAVLIRVTTRFNWLTLEERG